MVQLLILHRMFVRSHLSGLYLKEPGGREIGDPNGDTHAGKMSSLPVQDKIPKANNNQGSSLAERTRLCDFIF